MTFDEYFKGHDYHKRTRELAEDTFVIRREAVSWFNFEAFGQNVATASRALVSFTRALSSVS